MKVTTPSGEEMTRTVLDYKRNFQIYSVSSDVINDILPRVDFEYQKLLEKIKRNGIKSLKENLEEFLQVISRYVIVGGLVQVLSYDLKLNPVSLKELLISTQWFNELLCLIKKEYKRMNKEDFVNYAESVCQIVELFGLKETLKIFRQYSIQMKESTIRSLCRVANETPKIKSLIREKRIPLTIVFELPIVDEFKREQIAEEIASLCKSYSEAKNYLKRIKEGKIA
jgi:hypothetical protein